MLSAIVRLSLRFRGVLLSLAFAMLGYGLFILSHAKYDVFPEFAPPVVTIQTEAPGLSPEQVELLVTQPIENVINGVTGIASLRSNSIQGLSITTVIFQNGTDIYRNRQLVNERLATLAGQLPHGVAAPIIQPLTISTATVLVVGLTSESKSLMDLRTAADWTLRPRLLAVPGVAHVSVFGGEVKQIQVQPLPEKLVQYNLSISDVVAAAQKATGILGAGFIENANQRLVLQTEWQSTNPAQIAATVLVRQNGANATLGQVANVIEGPAPPFGAASIEGKTGVILSIVGRYGSNTADVTTRVEQALAELNPALRQQGISMRSDLFRPAKFIDIAVHNVRNSLLLGAALVILVLFLFLFDLRVAAISCSAIPLSLLVAVTIMDRMGYTLNTLSANVLGLRFLIVASGRLRGTANPPEIGNDHGVVFHQVVG
jgi:Cu/Ag efflux pump CusA